MSTEIISAVSSLERLVATPASTPLPTEALAVPPPGEIARMESAMNKPPEQHHGDFQVSPADKGEFRLAQVKNEIPTGDESTNIGDKMLDGLQKIKKDHSADMDAINKDLSAPELNVQSLMALQMKLSRLTLQEDLLAKTASKSTQNLDSLLKTQ